MSSIARPADTRASRRRPGPPAWLHPMGLAQGPSAPQEGRKPAESPGTSDDDADTHIYDEEETDGDDASIFEYDDFVEDSDEQPDGVEDAEEDATEDEDDDEHLSIP